MGVRDLGVLERPCNVRDFEGVLRRTLTMGREADPAWPRLLRKRGSGPAPA